MLPARFSSRSARVDRVGSEVHLADWETLGRLNQYRLFVIVATGAIYYLSDSQQLLGGRAPDVFVWTHTGYAIAVALFALLIRNRQPALDTQLYLHNYADVVMIGLLVYASGGVQSGLDPLLLIAIALLSHLTSLRYAMLFAAIATSVILAEELYARQRFGVDAADFERTAVLGVMLFAIAWLMTVPLRRLGSRDAKAPAQAPIASDAEVEPAPLDVAAIATLNEEIIRELDSGVVVIDSGHQVQLINDRARSFLGAEGVVLPIHLARLSDPLFNAMESVRRGPALGLRPFRDEATELLLLPHFISLSSGGMLIKLDDHAQIRHQFQQLKLASLGRLSASIAHEIRNPLGAITQSVQLLRESDTYSAPDQELLDITERHARRINGIVEDVLQLSQHRPADPAPLDIEHEVRRFGERFCNETRLPSARLRVHSTPGMLARFDSRHLEQVLWNLCTNAQLHNGGDDITVDIACWITRTQVAIIDVMDNGRGIDENDREQLFEPFFSTHQSGSGLGLFIIRELCEHNHATIECLENEEGAHFRISMLAARQMAA